MTAGRPSIYTPELVKRARGYLTRYQDMGDKVPSIAGLACVIGVTRETCHAWANDPEKAEFSHILKELMQRQERALLNGGLGGDFNAPITKMMLTKHGYSDKVETDVTSSDGSMTPRSAADAVLAALQAKHAPKPD
jgi:hypothetical protein